MRNQTRRITLTAMGAALFAALSMCLQAPVFENYYLCLGYAVMSVWCCCFGAVSGTVAGVLGTVVYCLLINGLRGLPGWAAGNAVIGLMAGWSFNHTSRLENRALAWAVNTMAMVLAAAVGILVVKSAVEWLLYSQPMALRMGKNVYGFAADAAVLVASLPICALLKTPSRRIFPSLAR